jgi:diketogulonate reductase-like aldo/keto reductase
MTHDPARRRTLRLVAGCGTLALVSPVPAQTSTMLERAIPRSGERLPVVGLGTWQSFDVEPSGPMREQLKEVLRELVATGGSVVDSSPMYGRAERVVGELGAELGLRAKLFLATKVWTSGREAGIRQMEHSIASMRAGSMDLMQVHNLLDVETHTKTLEQWKAAGKIRYSGITHYHAGAHAEIERLLGTRRYDFAQFNYSIAEREAESRLLPYCAANGIAVIANRPFAEGELFRQVRGRPLPPWCAEFDCTSWAQFFLKYILSHPAVTCVIPGTRRPQHMKDNLQAGMGRLPDAALRQRMVEYLQF